MDAAVEKARRAAELEVAEQAAARQAALDEAQHQADARRAAEAEAAKQTAARRAADEEAQRQADGRRAAEEEAARQSAARRAAEAEAAEQAAARQAAIENAHRQAEARRAAEAEAAKQTAARQAADEEARRQADARSAAETKAAEQTARVQHEADARRAAEAAEAERRNPQSLVRKSQPRVPVEPVDGVVTSNDGIQLAVPATVVGCAVILLLIVAVIWMRRVQRIWRLVVARIHADGDATTSEYELDGNTEILLSTAGAIAEPRDDAAINQNPILRMRGNRLYMTPGSGKIEVNAQPAAAAQTHRLHVGDVIALHDDGDTVVTTFVIRQLTPIDPADDEPVDFHNALLAQEH